MNLETNLQPYQFTFTQKITRWLMRRWYFFRYRVLDSRYGKLVLETIDGVPLIILPEVFNPVLLRSGEHLARTIANHPLQNPQQLCALDMGSGSGASAVFAARRGIQVTAVDINPEAVRCVTLNALLNKVTDKITVYQGDLFDSIGHQQFDLIFFNPPYFEGSPRDNLDHAWRGVNIFERFATGLKTVLKSTGEALIMLSTDGECDSLLKLLTEQDFTIKIVSQRNLINEIETIYSVRHKL